ncbi:MAG: OmpL47-type beta-barrel domain-containing protein, partial [Promethearchaeota archaeon]
DVVVDPVHGATCIDTYSNLLTPSPVHDTVTAAVYAPPEFNPFTALWWYTTPDDVADRGFNPLTLVYEALARPDHTGTIVPWLASSYSVNVVGSSCDVYVELPSDVVWHDLMPLTANDVAFTYDYMNTHQCPIFYEAVSAVTSVDVLDATHFVIHLSRSSYWDQIAILQVPILPMHIWSGIADPYSYENTYPVGSGPFMFHSQSTDVIWGDTAIDFASNQMVSINWPEEAIIWTEEAGDYLIGVDYFSGDLPLDYTITISYDGHSEMITGTITSEDVLSVDYVPASAYEIEGLHYVTLPASTEVTIVVDWTTPGGTADLDIYIWSPSSEYSSHLDSLLLQRWHDYYNSPFELEQLDSYVSITPSWASAIDFSVYWRANGPYDITDATVYWAYSYDNIAWTSWELLGEFTPLSTYGSGYIDFTAIYGEGYYSFRIEANDVIGHSSSYEFYTGVDLQAPVADAGQDWIIQQWDYFTFDGSGSSDNIEIASYEWTFYDEGNVHLWGPNPTYQFTHEGVFEVTLTVTDNAGLTSTDYMSITAVYDVLPPQTTVTGPPSGSTVSGDTTYVIESEDETGVDHTDVYLDGDLVLSVQSSVVDYVLDPSTINDGEHVLEFKVYDTFGLEAVTVYVVFTDTEPPDFWIEIPETPSEPFTAEPVVSSTDVERVEFWLDDVLVVTDYTDPYVFYVYTPNLLDGEHNLTIAVYDEAGNYAVEVRIFIIDTTAPETIPIVDGIEGENSWFQSDVTVTLQASDLYLGVAQTMYSFDGTDWSEYTTTITFDTNGPHWLYYYSVDTNGNSESIQSLEILIDKPTPYPQNPDQFVSDHPVNIYSVNGEIFAEWSGAFDSVSGVYGYSIEWSHEISTLPDTTVDTTSNVLTTTLDDGLWYLHLRVCDTAGNWAFSAYHIGAFKVDAKAPFDFEAVMMCTKGQDGWYFDDVTVTFHGLDLPSGIDYFMYSIDSGPWLVYSEPLYFDMNGFYSIRYYCVDNMGHVSEERVATFGIDDGVPSASNLVYGDQNPAGNYIDSATIDLSGYDSGDSGFAYVEYSIDGNPWHRYSDPFTVTREGLHTVLYFAVDNAGNCGDENSLQFTIISSEVSSETLLQDQFTTDSTGYDTSLWTLEQYGPGNVIWEDGTVLGIQSWDHGYRTLVSTRTFSPGCVLTFTARFSDWDALPAIGWTNAVPIPEIDGPWNYHPTIGPDGVWVEFNWPPSRYLTLYSQSNSILSYQSIFVEDYASYHTYSIIWETDLAVLTIDGVPAAVLSTDIPQVSLPVKMLSTSWAGEGPGQTFRLDSVRIETTGTSTVVEDTGFTTSTTSDIYIGDTYVDWDGSIWSAWTYVASYDAMLSHSSVFGPLPSPIDISPEVDGSTDNDAPFAILRATDGTLWIAYRAGTTWTSEYDYVRSYSASGLGPRYMIPTAAASNAECDFVQLSDGSFALVFAASDSIYIADSWRVYTTTSSDMMSWTSPVQTTSQYGRECRITVDSTDRLFAVVDNNDLGMLLLTSTDGATWSTPYVAASGHYGDIYYSATYGRLFLAYCNYTDMNIWIKESTDGVSWSEPWLAVDRVSSDPGNARICEDSEGRLIVTYRDSPDDVLNIFARRITLNEQPMPSMNLDWDTGTIGIVHDIKSGDVDGDGEPEIVVAIEPGYMSTGYVLIYNGITHALERTIYLTAGYARVLCLGDPDADGQVEILVGTVGWWETGPIAGIAVYDGATGELEWLSSINNGVYSLWVEDIDADGELEIVGITDYERDGDTTLNGLILVYDGKTHALEWSCSDYGVFIGGYHALANIDSDPALELIFGARTEMYPPFQGTLYIVDGGSHTTQASLSIGPYSVTSVQVATMTNGSIRIIAALREQDYTSNFVTMYDTNLNDMWSYSLGDSMCPTIVMPGNLDADPDFEIAVGIAYANGYWTGEFQVIDWATTQCIYQSVSSNAVISFYYGDVDFDDYAELAVGYHAGWSIGKMEIYTTGVSFVIPEPQMLVTEPVLDDPGLTSTDGTAVLSWSPSVSSIGAISYYQIQVSTSPAFSTINAEFSALSL